MRIKFRPAWRCLWLPATAVPALFAASLYSQDITDFKNMQGTVHCPAGQVVAVHNTAEVQDAVTTAIRLGLHVKAAINGWQGANDNSCVAENGVQLETSGLNKILDVDSRSAQVTVQPGIKLWDFNNELHERHRLVLPVAQEYAEVTLGGMIGNGTHGSSLQAQSSSIQDALVQVKLVDGLGQIRTIAGADLDYVASNLGVLGILTEVTLQVQPAFKVLAESSGHPDTDLASDVLRLAEDGYATNVTWFPGQNSYAYTRFTQVAGSTPGEAHNGQAETSWFNRKVLPAIFKLGNLTSGNRLMCLLEQQRYQMKSTSYFTTTFNHPAQNPVGWVHQMTSFVCRDRCPFKDLPYNLEEIAIPLESLPNFIDQARRLFDSTGACLPLNGVYFRFGKASRGAIGMASARDTVYVGMEYIRNPIGNGYPRAFSVIQELEQILLNDFDGRPHWGKASEGMFVGIQQKYPRWAEFEEYRQRLDPNGIFISPFYRRRLEQSSTGLSGRNCVVEASCYYHRDDECPAFYHCAPGLISPTAHICLL